MVNLAKHLVLVALVAAPALAAPISLQESGNNLEKRASLPTKLGSDSEPGSPNLRDLTSIDGGYAPFLFDPPFLFDSPPKPTHLDTWLTDQKDRGFNLDPGAHKRARDSDGIQGDLTSGPQQSESHSVKPSDSLSQTKRTRKPLPALEPHPDKADYKPPWASPPNKIRRLQVPRARG